MKRVIVPAFIAAALAGILLIQAQAPAADATKKASVGAAAPDFELKDGYGKTFHLSDFKGDIVVLEWINYECPVSRGKHADKTMQKAYVEVLKLAQKAAKGDNAPRVIWLGIDSTYKNGNGSPRKADQNRIFAAESGIAYPILQDPDGAVGHAYGARTTPDMFVVDQKGVLAYAGAIDDSQEPGGKGANYVVNAVRALLDGKTPDPAHTTPYGCGVKYK